MLDSHFEVRPLRIRANMKDDRFKNGISAENNNNNYAVKIEISEKDETGANKANWIGLERSYGNGSESSAGTTYCTGSGDYGPSSAGKRKYFTTDLTTNTLAGANGQTVIVPVTEAGECVWIYVDECDEEAEASTDLQAIRSAKITVTYGTLNGSEFTADNSVQPVEYVINQHLLYKIQSSNDLNGDGSTANDYYYIEHEEEYLYNFDAEDNYEKNQTQFEGMYWGLNNVQLSFDNRSAYVTSEGGILEGLTGAANDKVNAYSPFYDFYLEEDVAEELKDDIAFYHFAGYTFTAEIIADINNNGRDTNTEDYTIGALALDTKPRSAIEYCYGRNKVIIDDDGNITVDYKWYLPAIDEIQEIVTKAYIQFDDFQNKFYWSSQPAYIPRYIHYDDATLGDRHGAFMIDNKNYARATRFNNVTYDPSGALGYQDVLYIKENVELGWGGLEYSYTVEEKSTPYTHSYLGSSWTAPVVSYQTGYKHRTNKEDWCRVRAVRKMN